MTSLWDQFEIYRLTTVNLFDAFLQDIFVSWKFHRDNGLTLQGSVDGSCYASEREGHLQVRSLNCCWLRSVWRLHSNVNICWMKKAKSESHRLIKNITLSANRLPLHGTKVPNSDPYSGQWKSSVTYVCTSAKNVRQLSLYGLRPTWIEMRPADDCR